MSQLTSLSSAWNFNESVSSDQRVQVIILAVGVAPVGREEGGGEGEVRTCRIMFGHAFPQVLSDPALSCAVLSEAPTFTGADDPRPILSLHGSRVVDDEEADGVLLAQGAEDRLHAPRPVDESKEVV
jgi:hypothetical protein